MKLLIFILALCGAALGQGGQVVVGNAPSTTGVNNFTGAQNACVVNGVSYVGAGAPFSSCWGSTDIGAQINAAYVALPSRGGHIRVVAGSYTFSTPIVFAVAHKPVLLDCDPGSVTTATPTGVTQLAYAPTTGTAITLNNEDGPLGGFSGCTLTGPGSGTAAVGLLVGGTNGQFSDASVAGNNIATFGTGLQFGNNAYTVSFRDNYISDNGTNLSIPAGVTNSNEGINFYGGVFAQHSASYSTTCVNILSGVEMNFYGVSFDQCGITLNAGTFNVGMFGVHMENPGGATASDYITFGTSTNIGRMTISGGYFTEDSTSARTEFINSLITGSNDLEINVTGTVFSPAQATTSIFNNSGGGCCSRLFINGYANGIGGSQFTTEAAGLWYETLSNTLSPLGSYTFGDARKPGILTNANTATRTYTFPDASVIVAGINTPQTWTSAQSFNSGTLLPSAAGGTDVGSTSLPFGNLWLGAAATNNFKLAPASASGARIINIPDFGVNGATTQNFPSTVILTSQYTNSTTGFTNVAGGTTMAFPVLANTNYTATCHLFYQAASTGGLNIEFTGPSAPTAVAYGLDDPNAATTFNSVVATAYSTSLGQAIATAATNFDAIVSFGLVNGANAGTVTLLAKSSAAAQLQIQAGSFCKVQ